jgi:hypothetical protein
MFEQDAYVFLFYSQLIEMITRIEEAVLETAPGDAEQTSSDAANIARIEDLRQAAKSLGATIDIE